MKQLHINKYLTQRKNDAFDKYLKDVSKISLLSVEDETELSYRIKKGDLKALEQLVNSNLRFVISVAKQYQKQGLTLEDLISEGNIGLIKAAQRFDSTKGFKFISYAVWWIRQTILQAIAENTRTVRLPANKVLEAQRINFMMSKLAQEFEREPTAEEIAQALEMTAINVKEVISSNEKASSLEAPMSANDNKLSLIDTISLNSLDEDAQHRKSVKSEINQLLNFLDNRELTIIKMFFGIDYPYRYTLDDIALHFGLTRERIRQLKKIAMTKLKKHALINNV